jgi:superfamily II DNA or RNA helicase
MTDDTKDWTGLHERLATRALKRQLDDAGLTALARWNHKLSMDEVAPAMTAHFSQLLSRLALSLRDADRAAWEAALAQLAAALRASEHPPLAALVDDVPLPPFAQLQEIVSRDAQLVGQPVSIRPDLPLATSALLTGSARSPSLISQIKKELASTDRADWLVSFIKWSGIRPLRDELREFTRVARRDGEPRLRIATTSYLGATDVRAIEFLLELPNTQVRVSFDTHRTRLHAKAYLFTRETGFGSAYVGSANVSSVALDEGLEWTAKVSEHELPYLWRQIIAAFETHWEDRAEFETLDVNSLDRFRRALDGERPSGQPAEAPMQFFDLRPYAFQQEILDQIDAERKAGLNKHLIIAATGTGKTMLAAFDYRRFAAQAAEASQPSLLFIAHREEILRQSLATFRNVLRDQAFGDLVVAGQQPRQARHLFCSVQSWHSRQLDRLDAAQFDYVVLDEAHHAAAASYQQILNHIAPRVLLGLTATPERMDGKDIRDDFGGRFTHEIRLPDAVERRLLAPFHYFGISDHDSIDLSRLAWQRGGYARSQLENVFDANEVRAKWVCRQLQDYVDDAQRIRALGFCVSQAHARFMADKFSEWGIPSAALTANSGSALRAQVQRDLVARRIRCIFTVDLYNEGVDIPEVDTILLLRPTESLVVYLQQLGRGLRLHDDKPQLTVLDFIAPQHRQFRYASRLRALSSAPGERIDKQVEAGFPWLPSGCLISLDRIAQARVLDNIRDSLGMRRPQLVQSLTQYRQQSGAEYRLQAMLDWLHLDEADNLLRHGLPGQLLGAAGGPRYDRLGAFEKGFTRGARQLAALNDVQLLNIVSGRMAAESTLGLDALTAPDRQRLALAYSLFCGKQRVGDGTLEAFDAYVRARPMLRHDLAAIAEHRREQILAASNLHLSETGVLELHAGYTRDQIMLAVGKGRFGAPFTSREGVLHVPERKVDLFFVTVDKTEAGFSPTTMYEDYAVTDSLFHWQSQSTVGPDSPTGRRYIQHRAMGYRPMLFLRQARRQGNGLTGTFYFCGPLDYVRHQGSRPMSITWRLHHPMPARLFRMSNREAA